MIPLKFVSLSMLSADYVGIYSTITANYYWRMVSSLSKDDIILDSRADVGIFPYPSLMPYRSFSVELNF